MIRRMLRMDAGLEGLGTATLVAVGLGMVLRMMESLEGRGLLGDGSPLALRVLTAVLFWTLAGGALAGSKAWIRMPRFYMGLPISVRTAWRVRVAGTALGTAFVLAVALLVSSTGIAGNILSAPDPEAVSYVLLVLALSLLLMAIVLQFEGRTRKIDMGGAMIVTTGMLWVSFLVMSLLMPANALTIGLAFGLAAYLLRTQDRNLPTSFDLELQEPSREETATDETLKHPVDSARPVAATSSEPVRWLTTRILLRLLHHHWQGWVHTFVLVIYGLAVTHDYVEGDDSLFYAFYTTLFLVTGLSHAIARMHQVDHLPISRRRLFVLAVAPGLLAWGLGAVIGLQTRGADDTLVSYRRTHVRVPHEFTRLAVDGVVAETVAPWGETAQPTPIRVWPFSDAAVYRPYEFGDDNSDRFVSWLTHLAMVEVHGTDAPWNDPGPDAPDAERTLGCCTAPVTASHDLPSVSRSRTYGATAIALILISGLFGGMAMNGHSARATSRTKKWTVAVAVGIPIAVVLVPMGADAMGWTEMWAVVAVPIIALRRFTDAVGGAPSLWWWAATLTGALMLVVQMEIFGRIEASREKAKKEAQGRF